MDSSFEYCVATEAELPAMARLIHHAFGFPTEACEVWLRKGSLSDLRVAKEAGETVACLRTVPMGQHFGGRRLPMVGIAGVATAPERRGRGYAQRMMKACVEELAGLGVAMSTLFASTRELYRKVGYEQAGVHAAVRVPVAGLGGGACELAVRPLVAADEAGVREVQGAWGLMWPGSLARGKYIWDRIAENRGNKYDAFGVVGPLGQIEGYVYLSQVRRPDAMKHDVLVSDVAWTTPRAGRTLLAFLGGFGTMADEVEVLGSPGHPLLAMAPGVERRVTRCEMWMVRLTDVQAALAERGYCPSVRASVVLDVHDELLPQNDGLWTLDVEDGLARVKQGGDHTQALRLGVRGLAAIFTGHMRASHAALLGWAHAQSPGTLRAADAVFGGGEPWLADFF